MRVEGEQSSRLAALLPRAYAREPRRIHDSVAASKIANKSVDKLLYYAGRLGIEAKAKFAQTHKEIVERELAMADTTA